jgi:precorrin-3B methylase
VEYHAKPAVSARANKTPNNPRRLKRRTSVKIAWKHCAKAKTRNIPMIAMKPIIGGNNNIISMALSAMRVSVDKIDEASAIIIATPTATAISGATHRKVFAEEA